jgi:hypothetical protein
MSYDPSNPLYNIAVPSPRNKVKRATAKFIADRPKATTEKALEGYDYLRSNSNKLEYNNSMHNISIGDILTDSNEVYRVIAIHNTEESLDNPYLEVAVFIWEGDILKFSHEGFIVVTQG